jgi:hypothetical protein
MMHMGPPRIGAQSRLGGLVDPQGWWGLLLQGALSAVLGGVVAALTAWAVVTASHRHQERAILLAGARRAAVEMFHLAGRYLTMLERAREDPSLPVPNTEGPDWLIAASSVEIAMFSLPGDIGSRISNDLGAARRALEMLNNSAQRETEAVTAGIRCIQALTDDLADWLMEGRHLAS